MRLVSPASLVVYIAAINFLIGALVLGGNRTVLAVAHGIYAGELIELAHRIACPTPKISQINCILRSSGVGVIWSLSSWIGFAVCGKDDLLGSDAATLTRLSVPVIALVMSAMTLLGFRVVER